MYVALRHLKEQLPSGQVVDLYPGDVVTTFDAWPYNNKVSAISYRLVAKAPDVGPVDAEALLSAGPNTQVRAELAQAHGWGRRDYVPVQPLTHPVVATVAATDPAPGRTLQKAVQLALPSDAAELERVLGIDVHACEHCDYVASTGPGLKTHRSRMHKARAP